jgi:hypothetical protein
MPTSSGASHSASPHDWAQATRAHLALRHYSARTAEAYLGWLRRFLAFRARWRGGGSEEDVVRAFLNDLATRRNVSAAT